MGFYDDLTLWAAINWISVEHHNSNKIQSFFFHFKTVDVIGFSLRPRLVRNDRYVYVNEHQRLSNFTPKHKLK
jgi:hypothetical protein